MPAAKKSAAKAPAKRRGKSPAKKKAAAEKGKSPDGKRGPKLNAAQQSIRDALMVARRAQDWPWAAVAEEAGLSVRAAKQAVKVRRESMPLRLEMDPVEIVERVAEGLQLSIGDLEALAFQAVQKDQLAVSVAAKRSANDAREKLLAVVQATGRLPQELGALRHLIDLRAIAVRMLDTLDEFDRDMAVALELGNARQRKAEGRKAAEKVRVTFEALMGMEERERPDVDSTARQISAKT